MGKNKRLIGIYGVQIYEQNVMPFIQILKRESEKNGYHLISFSGSTNNQNDTEEIIGQYELINLIQHVDICALIILTETIRNERIIRKLFEIGKKRNIPVFSLDRKVDGCYNLLMNNEGCFEQIVRHVVEEHGCRYVNMIAGDKGNRFSEERIDMYRKVLAENNIPFEEERIGYGDYWECPVTAVMKQFFESDLPFPDAIVCANDIMAHAAITILNNHGLEVPEDIIVTGYDGTKDGFNFFPSLTTGAPDYEQMIQQIFKELAKCSDTKEIAPCDIVIPVVMKKRQSCSCMPKIIPKTDRRNSNLLTEIGNSKWHMQCMRLMLSDTFGMQRIEDIFPIIPKHMDVWFRFYRSVYLKSELLHSYEVSETDMEMTSILEGNCGQFSEIGKNLNIADFQSYIDTILEDEKFQTILVHPIISGKDVYGFSVEGFEELIDWQMKHCDEFAMFVSHILHTVIHNYKMNKLNENLCHVNKEVEKMSLCDSMTGIYNRRGFFHKINQIVRNKENNGKYLYLFMVDMDGLKYINDNFGHAEGDFALVTLSNVLNDMGNSNSICARVGGDEFICSYIDEQPHCYSADGFNTQMECMLKASEGVTDKSYPVAASVGMISEQISETLDLDSIINRADGKMYHNKMAKKHQVLRI